MTVTDSGYGGLTLQGRGGVTGTVLFRRLDGRIAADRVTVTVTPDAAGVPVYLVGQVMDVTAERAAARALAHQAASPYARALIIGPRVAPVEGRLTGRVGSS